MKKIFAVMLATLLLCTLSFSVFAAKSPEGTKVNTVYVVDGANAETVNKEVVVGEKLELKADANKGTFDGWKIYKTDGTAAVEGVDYKLVEGYTLKDGTLVIIPLSSIIVAANYGGVVTPIKPIVDKVPVAPSTGDAAVVALAAVMSLALVGAVVSKKQFA